MARDPDSAVSPHSGGKTWDVKTSGSGNASEEETSPLLRNGLITHASENFRSHDLDDPLPRPTVVHVESGNNTFTPESGNPFVGAFKSPCSHQRWFLASGVIPCG